MFTAEKYFYVKIWTCGFYSKKTTVNDSLKISEDSQDSVTEEITLN